ncbi:MAG: formate--tetrahydrofolate ligase, partial [Myxococcota bacterium]
TGSPTMQPIPDIAARLGISEDNLIPYGRDKAKVDLSVLDRPRTRDGVGRLVLVSAITPTPAGEGKTTTTIGLGQALQRAGESVCLALREPSMGPCFGIKGGGTGGGKSQLIPTADINMHLTGDLHAVTAAHNLLAAMVDNHLHFRSKPRLNIQRILWRRVMDMNDRSLRNIVVGLGGRGQGTPRETGFDITAASELMAILCLSENFDDLRTRLARTLVGFDEDGNTVTADDIGATGAMLAILRDAIQPNLVQTMEGTPALVHGGPFANIAHGCNSVLATKMALHTADWTITEAGFGFDLGAEKFFDIKCASAGLSPSAVVLVATVRALKMHGGVGLKELKTPNPAAVEAGLPNLAKHIESAQGFGVPVIVAINHFGADTDDEVAVIESFCEALGVPVAVSRHFAEGGAGAAALAEAVIAHAAPTAPPLSPMYRWSDPIPTKIENVAKRIYGADRVVYSNAATNTMRLIKKLELTGLPICIAKTHRSLSDDPKRLGRPTGFPLNVQSIQINAGAGLLVVLTGDIVRMPGLPRSPSALHFDVIDGCITGVW